MTNINIKNNKGFALLFAVTISAIILAIALGISSVSFKELNFSTSARDTESAFYAADLGLECALYWDRSDQNKFPLAGPASAINCNVQNPTPTFSGTATTATYNFIISSLGTSGQGCANVTISKNNSIPPMTTLVVSKGYNNGGASCTQGTNTVERELDSTY